jgi:hypothetical protein
LFIFFTNRFLFAFLHIYSKNFTINSHIFQLYNFIFRFRSLFCHFEESCQWILSNFQNFGISEFEFSEFWHLMQKKYFSMRVAREFCRIFRILAVSFQFNAKKFLAVSFQFNAKKVSRLNAFFKSYLHFWKNPHHSTKRTTNGKINIGGIRGNLKNITKRKYIKSGDVIFCVCVEMWDRCEMCGDVRQIYRGSRILKFTKII